MGTVKRSLTVLETGRSEFGLGISLMWKKYWEENLFDLYYLDTGCLSLFSYLSISVGLLMYSWFDIAYYSNRGASC